MAHRPESSNMILRKRREKEEGLLSEPVDTPLTRAVKSLDFYPKVHQDRVKKQTIHGFILSMSVMVVILVMVTAELVWYVGGYDAYHERLSVDAGIGQKVKINLNLTFPSLRCDRLHLDLVDASGEMQIDVKHDLYKSPVDSRGRLIFSGSHPFYHAPENADEEGMMFFGGYDPAKDPKSDHFCGPCDLNPVANAQQQRKRGKGEEVECCNTCKSVLDWHKNSNKKIPDRGDVEQCIYEESMRNPGCNIAGILETEKVKGSFLFAPGGTKRLGFKMLHFFSTSEAMHFDTTHIINHLSFGDKKVKRFSSRGETIHPLDGTKFEVPPMQLAQVTYLLKAIPATYTTHLNVEDEEAESGTMVAGGEPPASSFEISATKVSKLFDPHTSRRAPELMFVYDFHPMQITHVFHRPPFAHFLLNLCKIVGGFFVVTGMLDRMISKIMGT